MTILPSSGNSVTKELASCRATAEHGEHGDQQSTCSNDWWLPNLDPWNWHFFCVSFCVNMMTCHLLCRLPCWNLGREWPRVVLGVLGGPKDGYFIGQLMKTTMGSNFKWSGDYLGILVLLANSRWNSYKCWVKPCCLPGFGRCATPLRSTRLLRRIKLRAVLLMDRPVVNTNEFHQAYGGFRWFGGPPNHPF